LSHNVSFVHIKLFKLGIHCIAIYLNLLLMYVMFIFSNPLLRCNYDAENNFVQYQAYFVQFASFRLDVLRYFHIFAPSKT